MADDETFFHLYRRSSEPEESGTVELSASLEPVREELEEIARRFDPSDPDLPRRRHTRLYDPTYHALTRFEPAGDDSHSFVARTFVVPDRWLDIGGYDLDAAFEALPWEILTPPHLEALDPDERHVLPELPAPGLAPGHRKVDERLQALETSLGELAALAARVERLERSHQTAVVARPTTWWRDGRVLILVGILLALLVASLAWALRAATDPAAGSELPLDRRTVGQVLETGATHDDPAVRDRAAALYLDLLLDDGRTVGSRERDALVQQLVGDTPDGAFGTSSRRLLETHLDTEARCCSDLVGIPRRTCTLSAHLGLSSEVVCSGRFPFDGDLPWSAGSATALLELSRQARAGAPDSMARRLETLDLVERPSRASRLPTLVVDPGEAARLADLAARIGWEETDSADRVE